MFFCVSFRVVFGFRSSGFVVVVGGWGIKRLLWVFGFSFGFVGRLGRTGF